MVFKGEIDSVDNIDLLNGIVSIKGRDLSRRLIDATTRETFTNKKSSDVAKLLASRHNLQADVDNTSVLVGTFYQFEHDKLTHDSLSKTTKEFDLLKFLAQKEGYDFWVSGDTLYFKQPVDQDTAFPFKLIWTGRSQTSAYPYLPATDIRLSRSLTLAKDSKVIVKTWDSKSKKSAEFTYPTSAKADAQQYVFLRPGLTPDQAIKFAQSQYTEIIKHERLVSITMPGELDIDARSIVELVGTNTSFDQRYYVDSIDRQWSQDAGFRQTLNLKNHTTQTQTTVE
jgi:phage protein D